MKKREQVNELTAFVDGSQVYGSENELAKELRSSEGLLNVTRTERNGDLPPLANISALEGPSSLCVGVGGCFLAGLSRANEQLNLLSMHTLFVREHNRIVKKLEKLNSHWDGEKKCQEARKMVEAILQKITYEDFLPLILGPNPLNPYKLYQPNVNPCIFNSFATAAFRFANDLLENLFVRPNSPGLNLVALNIQRGRDHGLPGYNSFRVAVVGPTAKCIIQKQMEALRNGDRFFYLNKFVFSSKQLREIEKSLSRVYCDNHRKKIVSIQRNAFLTNQQRITCERIPKLNVRMWKDSQQNYAGRLS
ncbi:peroxidasin homolog pxn-2-like [Xenia sp. Carnegie-2017]|uniref:peroxidasin homolog pxn-2-like n=1 Tax=Xenia sp. Carnegie-2017 TaxID=2897299 RepID=UPI001F04765E|nr:peroxidasin homolog pxn-2-like [Xenia sp. Carnegie-2017]